ncbi:MAG TPA: ASKHA domain-containing protein [Candidatus Sumerlaeota bacterium]|nr:ASKHA domain-containing protein [Candidatus Sumerlaeota bacterium]HPK02186.1 ASKHA domain-containing protein [Candidatus Sumerlaeota bacterium]
MSELFLNQRRLDIQPGATLFDAADLLGLKLPSSCGRHGSCHECIIQVTAGEEALNPRTENEDFLRGGYRLACQCRLERPEPVVHAHALRRGTPQIAASGRPVPVALAPAVTRGPDDTVLLDGEPIAQRRGPLLGAAADIGTTTVVLRLVDLETGQIVAAQSFENPQMFGGGDVMGRITYDRETKRRDLQQVLVAYLNRSLGEFCEALGAETDDIYEFVAVGNATMRDLLFGYDVQTIGVKPFMSVSEIEFREGQRETTALACRPTRLRLAINRKGRVWGAPLIACHVGADTAACVAAVDVERAARPVIIMDIGTNTELVVGHGERVLCASCPAGPAFEGARVTWGMPGLEGAIESVRLENGQVDYRVIGDAAPAGICGSGMIDALGELLRTGRMNMLGRLEDGDGRFLIAEAAGIYLSNKDISELAQAKGANIAGILILLRELGLTLEEVDRFYLAGGFAQYIDIEHAIRIGMLPRMPVEKFEKLGNAAIEGATALLCSTDLRRRLDAYVHRIGHVELENHPAFFGYYVEGMQFKASDEMAPAGV